MKYLFACFLSLGLLTACTSSENKETIEELPRNESTARLAIYVKKDGRVYMNERITTLEKLEEALKKHRVKGGMVFYSREDQQADPHDIAIQVMDLIAKQELPIQFYTDSTFRHIVEF